MALVEWLESAAPRLSGLSGGAPSAPRRRVSQARLLRGRDVPSVGLPFAPGAELVLSDLASAFPLVVCLFGAIGSDSPFPREIERIRNWQHRRPELAATGHRLVAISSESFLGQARSADLLTDWTVLSDIDLDLARLLGLPVVEADDASRYEPATLVAGGGRIRKCFASVDARDAERTIDWIRRRESIRIVPARQVQSL